MPKFSENSKNNLNECHFDLKLVMKEAIRFYDFSVIEGYRPEVEQNAAFESGTSKLKYPESKHNVLPARACDIVPYPTAFSSPEEFYFLAGIVLTIAKQMKEDGRIHHDVRWGGDWDRDLDLQDQNFNDLPHFELV